VTLVLLFSLFASVPSSSGKIMHGTSAHLAKPFKSLAGKWNIHVYAKWLVDIIY
jgi:hypothetical protein